MQCFVTDIPDCLEAISSQGILQNLELKLSNKSNSPTLEFLLLNSPHFRTFSKCLWPLKELVVDSSNLVHVRLPGRSLLLDILGKGLESLSFIGSCPGGVFGCLDKRCPKLKSLRVDRAISVVDFEAYRNDNLEHLELCRPNFVMTSLSQFPRLRHFRFTPCSKVCLTFSFTKLFAMMPTIFFLQLDLAQVSDVVRALPANLEVVSFSIHP